MLRKGWYLLILFTCCSACVFGVGDKRKRNNAPLPWHLERKAHVGMQLSPEDLQQVVAIGNETHFFDTLKPILTTRVVDTPGHAAVRQFIVNQMENLGWTVEQHRFEDHTPLGTKNFTNIVATLQPSVPRRLVLACHYDSKLTPEGFLGAIDSAVPCAMLINLAHTLRKRLTEFKTQPSNVTLQFLFFDGEEALVTWNDHDSLYGARRLAQKWHQTPFPLGASRDTSELHRIDLFVLLDLIGTKDTSFYSLFDDSEHWYSSLVDFEKILERGGALKTRPLLFRPKKFHGMGIEDDHIPFMRKGVPILHLISYPFPSVWHKMSDNFESLDPATIENMNTILRAFVVHYLHLTRP